VTGKYFCLTHSVFSLTITSISHTQEGKIRPSTSTKHSSIRFWSIYRHGIQHQASPKSDSVAHVSYRCRIDVDFPDLPARWDEAAPVPPGPPQKP
jgi:hypothetical protein